MTFLEKTKRFFEPIKERPSIYIEGFFVAFLWGVNGVMHIFFLERITYYLAHEQHNFQWILLVYAISIIFYEVINFLLRKCGWVKIEGYTTSFASEKYLASFIQIDNNYIESLGTGKLINIIREGVDRWGFLLWQAIEVLVRLFVAIGFTIFVLIRIELWYTGIFLCLFLIAFVISRYFNNRLFPYRRERQLNRADISRHMVKILMSKNEILQNNSINTYNSDIAKLYEKDVKINQDMGTFRTLLVRNSSLLIIIVLFMIYYIFGLKVISGQLDISLLVGLTGSIIVIQRIVTESIFSYIDFTKEFIKVDTLWEIFDNAPQIKGYSTGSPFSPTSQNIEIQNISYGYNDTPVFSDFSLTIKRGQKTALVGASGGGKTTLMKLIAGYLHPESGSISVLGNRLDETALKTYYPHIGYLTQDPGVFDATIRENLVSAISDPFRSVMSTELPVSVATTRHLAQKKHQKEGKEMEDFSSPTETGFARNDKQNDKQIEEKLEQQLIRALRLAHCDFVFELEHGLDTEIGERGVRLSGGQKQRLAIAKIFLKDPEIILLDEPTSALDSFSEEAITVALDELFRDRTVIIVAHRLQTVRKADEILVLEGGRVVERGDHTTLVAKGGIYNRMLELQSGF